MAATLPAYRFLFVIVVFLMTVATTQASAEDVSADEAAFFESKIRPALIEHCAECHWSDTEASGGLLLDSKDGWSEGGDLGPAIVPGDAAASLLIKAIEYQDPALEMPPDGKLPESTIAAFRKWIRSGAFDPRQSASSPQEQPMAAGLPVERAQEHWAYRPIEAPPVSLTDDELTDDELTDDELTDDELTDDELTDDETNASGAISTIDVLLNRRISESGLVAAPEADRRRLIRRLTFDLHGLPPSIDQIEAFVTDDSPDAYDRLVDRLLASPRFAEHFARRWLDVVRYAESITLRGFILPQAWRYRDYVIEAYAQDRPFDQMIRDQIAGDLMPTDDLVETQRRALGTGFLALGNSNLEDQDKTKLEFDHLDEQLETIGRAFLAQTIGCARCHDHKFDPIPTRDYYALAGIMRSTTPMKHANLSKWIEQPLPLTPEREAYYQDLQHEMDQIDAELKTLKGRLGKATKQASSIVAAESLEGVVVDDSQATFVGEWTKSDFVKSFVGEGYQHDGTTGQGSKSVTFDPPALESGRYEVRMSYTAHQNRATNVPVKIFSANESTTILVNQRKRPPEDGLWISLGVFPFEKQGQSFVIVSNDDADGVVIVDAIQFLPVDRTRRSQAANRQSAAESASESDGGLAEIQARIDGLEKRLKKLQSESDRRPKYLTILESEPKKEIAIRIRGNVHQLGDAVGRGFLSAIGPAEEYARRIDSSGSGRVELAGWISDPRNPLTARVYVNRVWSWLMGEGVVATENNFGTTGALPSHPRLLDHLAADFMRGGWSTKRLVRSIVGTDAYRRAVVDDANRIAIDPGNRLYSSGSIKRVPVEALRDAMLSVSGELDRSVGGSLIRSGTKSDYNYRHDSRRRGVYSPVFRNSLPPLFDTFDFADSSVSVGQRSRSTVATQSLAMLNHPWVIDRSKRAAERFRVENRGQSSESLVRRCYQACFGRDPDAQELELCLDYLGSTEDAPATDRLADFIQSLFASIDFRYLE